MRTLYLEDALEATKHVVDMRADWAKGGGSKGRRGSVDTGARAPGGEALREELKPDSTLSAMELQRRHPKASGLVLLTLTLTLTVTLFGI